MNRKNKLMINIKNIKETIASIDRSFDPALLAVTKTVDAEVIKELYELGLTHFGENRTNVLNEKILDLKDIREGIQWHFIGRLQSRQVKSIINDIDYLHSLDRLSLAKEIQKRADKRIKCFVQVNVSGEESKAGFTPDELEQAISDLAQFDKIYVVGLMTMAPYDASSEEIRQYFSQLKELQEAIKASNYSHAPCTELSMGMSQDYPIAIEEGSTIIRIGSALYEGIEYD